MACSKDNAMKVYPGLKGGIIHSNRGSQYSSEFYRNKLNKYGIIQSMNSDGGDVMITPDVKVCGRG